MKPIRDYYPERFRPKKLSGLIMLLVVFVLITGCASQHKFKKPKSVPCPCEKENKR